MNPYTSTREEFTRSILSVPTPDDAAKDWADSVTRLKKLLEKLTYHEAMAPNLQQTYMTPAASKNRVYFMWDFVGRTLGMFSNVDPKLPKNRSTREAWSDVLGRSMMASQLILDTKPGMLNMMIESTNPEQKGKHPEFGDEIKALAREICPE